MAAESDEKNTSPLARKRLPWLLAVALLVVGFGLRQTLFSPDPLEVRVERVTRGPVEATVTNSKAGTVEARRRSRIAMPTCIANVRMTCDTTALARCSSAARTR